MCLYFIICRCKIPISFQPQESLLWMVNNTRLDACGLVPYTKYLIQIAAKPWEGGLWSEVRSLNITTHKAGRPSTCIMIVLHIFCQCIYVLKVTLVCFQYLEVHQWLNPTFLLEACRKMVHTAMS